MRRRRTGATVAARRQLRHHTVSAINSATANAGRGAGTSHPEPALPRLGSYALPHARVKTKRRLDRRHLVQQHRHLAHLLRAGPASRAAREMSFHFARSAEFARPSRYAISSFETSSHFMMAFLPPRAAPLAAPQAAPVAPAGFRKRETTATSARFPSNPKSWRSLRNPSLRTYAAARRRVAFPAARQIALRMNSVRSRSIMCSSMRIYRRRQFHRRRIFFAPAHRAAPPALRGGCRAPNSAPGSSRSGRATS